MACGVAGPACRETPSGYPAPNGSSFYGGRTRLHNPFLHPGRVGDVSMRPAARDGSAERRHAEHVAAAASSSPHCSNCGDDSPSTSSPTSSSRRLRAANAPAPIVGKGRSRSSSGAARSGTAARAYMSMSYDGGDYEEACPIVESPAGWQRRSGRDKMACHAWAASEQQLACVAPCNLGLSILHNMRHMHHTMYYLPCVTLADIPC